MKDKLKVKVGPSRLLDMMEFKNIPRRRDRAIEASPDMPIDADFRINDNARLLHPRFQKMVVVKTVEHPEAGSRTLVLKKTDGSPSAWFRAGQFVSVRFRTDMGVFSRPYSMMSSPAETKDGIISITVKRKGDGYVSSFAMNGVKEGDRVLVSEPCGQFFHDSLRDSDNVVAVAGGSGITPFMSMARAIRDGVEDFNLTILYGSRTWDSVLFRKELEEIAAQTGRVRVINVLSDEEHADSLHGLINADIIRRYAPEDYSLFICGPEGLHRHMDEVVMELGLPPRRVRREAVGIPPADAEEKIFHIRVIQGPVEHMITASSRETLLGAMEWAGIRVPSRCRTGECGWCRSLLLSGKVRIPEQDDRRRLMDRKTGRIHPCCSFPASDLVIEIPADDMDVDF